MALVIESGSRKTDATSYVTVAEYNTYLDARYPARSAITTEVAEGYILRAMDYFESREFQGTKASELQSLQFPRNGLMIDGWGKDGDSIPQEVKTSVYELGYGFEQGYGVSDPVPRETISESVGGVSVTYKGSSAERVLTPAATHAMRKLVRPATRVVRM